MTATFKNNFFCNVSVIECVLNLFKNCKWDLYVLLATKNLNEELNFIT